MSTIIERVDALEKWRAEIDIFNIKNSYELKELIVSAVQEGQKQTLIEIEKINARVEILENKDAEKALEEKNRMKCEKLENKKFIRNTILACAITLIITFFGTIFLNNLLASKSFGEQLENYKNGQEVVNK